MTSYTNIHHISNPTKVYTTYLNLPQQQKNQYIKEIYRIGDKQNHTTNVKAIMSSYNITEDSNMFGSLINTISDVVNDLNIFNDNKFSLKMLDVWSSIYKKGHKTIPHIHSPFLISFTYYFKANPNASPLIFDDCNFKIHPQDDLLAIFPSHLTHSVPEHTDDEDRICLAGNFFPVFK